MKSIQTILLFYLLIISPNISLCQKDYSFQLISKPEGLSHRQVCDVYQDSENRIWICTGGGLDLLINGEIRNISDFVDGTTKLSNNQIQAINKDKRGHFWVSTGEEIFIFYPSLRRVELFPLSPNNEISFERMYSISITEDNVKWIPSVDKLIKIDTNHKVTIIPVKEVGDYIEQCILFDNKIWILGNIGGIIEMSLEGKLIKRHDSFYSFNKNSLIKSSFDDIISLNIYKNELIALSNMGNFLVYQRDEKRFIDLTEKTCPDYYFFNKLLFDYISQDESLLNIFSNNTKKFILQGFFVDDKNRIWGKTINGIVLAKEKKNYFRKAKGIENTSFRNIYEANDSTFFIGSYQGFYSFNPKKNLIQEVPVSQPNIFVIEKLDEDNILLASDGGWLGRYNVKNREYNKIEIDYDKNTRNFFCASKREDGKIWLGGFNLYLLDIENLTIEEIGREQLNIEMINDLLPYKNDLLIACLKGLYIKDKKDKVVFYPLAIENKNSAIFDIHEGEYPYFWLGTNNGLIQFNIEDGSFNCYNNIDGLANNTVQSILPEGDNYLWLGTENGLSKFDIASKIFINYDETDGLSHNEFMKGSALISSKGDYYMGSIAGLNSFNPAQINAIKKDKTPDLNIFSYFFYDSKKKESVETLTAINSTQSIIIPKDAGFWGVNFGNDNIWKSNNYVSYMLEGYDTDWINTKENKIQYTNIPGGQYTFKVRLANKENTKNKTVELKFIKEEYFYKSKWMYGLIAILFASSLLILYRYKLFQTKKIIRIRETLAADLHDDIGATLSSVNVLVKDTDNLDSNLKNIISLNMNAMLSIRDLSWTLNPNREKVKDLKLRMEQHLDDVVRPLNIPFTCKFEGLNMQRRISANNKHHLFLIFKEAINNALKHTKTTEISILASKKGKTFKMQISNKFNGKIAAKDSSNNGLINMQRRADALKGKISFKNLSNEFQIVFLGEAIP